MLQGREPSLASALHPAWPPSPTVFSEQTRNGAKTAGNDRNTAMTVIRWLKTELFLVFGAGQIELVHCVGLIHFDKLSHFLVGSCSLIDSKESARRRSLSTSYAHVQMNQGKGSRFFSPVLLA